MKKAKMLVSVILMVCTLSATFAFAADHQMRLAQISENNVAQLTYLHVQPNDEANITFGYNKGVFLMVLSEDKNGWCFVSIGNQQGYVKKSELTTENATTGSATLGIALISPNTPTSRVNLRESPSLDANILKKMNNGDEVIVMGITDGWSHIMAGDLTGYIKDEFLRYSGRDTKLNFMDITAPLVIEETQTPTTVTSKKKATAQPQAANPVITPPVGSNQESLKDSFSKSSTRGYNVSAEFKAVGNGKYQIYIRLTAPAGYVENDVVKSFNAYINGSKVSVPQQNRNNKDDGGFEATYSATTSFAGFIDTVHIAPVNSSGGELSGEDMFFSNILAN